VTQAPSSRQGLTPPLTGFLFARISMPAQRGGSHVFLISGMISPLALSLLPSEPAQPANEAGASGAGGLSFVLTLDCPAPWF
jgi:hypothetical protein